MAWTTQDRLKPYASKRTGPCITPAMRKTLEEKYFPRYPWKQACMLPLFHMVMHEYGYIPPEAIVEAAALLEVTPAQVSDAVTFYEEFRFDPSGAYVVNVCRSIACELGGYEKIVAKIKDVFGIDPNETTDDNKITLFEVECIGCCEFAPVALVNGKRHGNLTPEGFVKTLAELPATPVDTDHDASLPAEPHSGHVHEAARSARGANEQDKRN